MNEVEFKAGDRVRVVRNTESLYGNTVPKNTEGTILSVRTDGYAVIGDVSGAGRDILRSVKTADLELAVAEVIEVGDVVKATHTEGTTVQGVIVGVSRKSWVQIEGVPGTLYGSSWSFEIVSKAVKPIKVWDVISGERLNELPQDAVVRETVNLGVFLVDASDEILVHTCGTRRFSTSNHLEYRVEYLPKSKSDA